MRSMGEVSIGTSIGIALYPEDAAGADELLRRADFALYSTKDRGRARARFFEPQLSEIVQDKIILARDLARALGSGEGLHLHYQPQVDLVTSKVVGFEALIRWKHPTRGNVPPSEFIPLAESSKLICDLGLWVVRQACLQLIAWDQAGHPRREVAVNVSAAQFWFSDLENDVQKVVLETGAPPELLCLEVTESMFVRDAEGRVLRAFRR